MMRAAGSCFIRPVVDAFLFTHVLIFFRIVPVRFPPSVCVMIKDSSEYVNDIATVPTAH